MYCPSCGNTVQSGLKYCSTCGARIAKPDVIDKHGTPGKMLDNILTTIFLVVMFGLGILVGLVAVLLGNQVRVEPVVVIVMAYLAAVFGICYKLLTQVPKLIDAKLRAQTESYVPAPLEDHHPAKLIDYREPAMSVTDRTTKTLDKVPVK